MHYYVYMIVGDSMLDMTNVLWSPKAGSRSGGTYGCYYKYHNNDIYYKLSSFAPNIGFYGQESIYEVAVSRFCDLLGIPHIHYDGDIAIVSIDNELYTTYVCYANDFSNGCSKILYENLCKALGYSLKTAEYNFKRLGVYSYYCLFNILDFLTINRDRHSANIEFLKTDNGYSIVPPFDNGLSLIATCTRLQDVQGFDVMKDYAVNTCLVNDRSLYSGLGVIGETDITLNKLSINDLYDLFDNEILACLPDYYFADKIVEILYKRYTYCVTNGIFLVK